MSLLIDDRLQSKFGTKRTKSRVKFFEIIIESVLVTFERDPSTILIVKFSWHGLYLWKIVAFPVIWSDALKSTTHRLIFFLLTFKAFNKFPLCQGPGSNHRGDRSLL